VGAQIPAGPPEPEDAVTLEQQAQEAGERRLAYCNAILFEGEGEEMPEELAGEQAAAPYCGCDTCIVREVLDAAWKVLLAIKEEEVCS
jgi:hypothetical protein